MEFGDTPAGREDIEEQNCRGTELRARGACEQLGMHACTHCSLALPLSDPGIQPVVVVPAPLPAFRCRSPMISRPPAHFPFEDVCPSNQATSDHASRLLDAL
jgi:hypothetical protein